MIILTIATALLLAPPAVEDASPLQSAQGLYDEAKYEEALQELGADCQASATALECEQLRAFCNIALGDEGAARAAFDRLLLLDGYAELGSEVSPKLQAMFAEAKRAMIEVLDMQLEPPVVLSAGSPVLLEVYAPIGVVLESVHVQIVGDKNRETTPVEFQRRGDVWSARATLAPGAFFYFIEAALTSGVLVSVGSAAAPLQAMMAGATAGGDGGPIRLDGDDDALGGGGGYDDEPQAAGDGPDWALWSVVGGSAAVVALGVTLGIVLLGGGDSGNMNVHVDFRE